MIDRRTLIAGLSAALLAPRSAFAQTMKDAAGRTVPIPANHGRERNGVYSGVMTIAG